jgi:glutamyl-tRNA synthetase
VIVNEKRQKLSKRRDKVSLESYQREGFIAPAMKNYLMLLGWGPGDDQEILPWDEIEARFRLSDVNTSPAFFDVKKLRAFNGEYIRKMGVEEFAAACRPWLTGEVPWRPEAFDQAAFAQLAPLAQTRVAVLSEIVDLVDFVFLDAPVIDEQAWARAMKDPAADVLRDALAAYQDVTWEADALKTTLERVGATYDQKLGKAQAPVRVAVTGRTVGLPLFESLVVLGPERTLARMAAALDRARRREV